jgi:hypothetical protein
VSTTGIRTDHPSREGTPQAGLTMQRSRPVIGGWWGPLATASLSTVAMAQALQVWGWRPGVPLEFDGDSAFVLMQVKDILDHGWYWANPDVGAPFGQTAGWFADASWTHYAAVKVLGLLSSSPATVSALYFFVCFPLAALTAYWLARHVGISRMAAIVVGVLFSVLPGHQTMFSHLWLAAYWVLPLALWLVVNALQAPDDRVTAEKRSRWPPFRRVVIVILVGLGGVYYVVFTLILLAGGAVLALVGGLRTAATRAAVGAAGVGLVAAVPLLASLLQRRSDVVTGSTPGVREFAQSETYAGKLVDLFLPWIDHRLPSASLLTRNYNGLTVPSEEHPALGLVALLGAMGLLVLVLALLLRSRTPGRGSATAILGVLLLVSLAFYTRGGLGSVAAVFLSPQIRTWSRFILVIGLIGLVAVGLALTAFERRKGRFPGVLLASLALVVGVVDQTNPSSAPTYDATGREESVTAAYVEALQVRLPQACNVFQYPVLPFPEEPPIEEMQSYDQLRSYIVSTSLKWSYGAMKGTSAGDWQRSLPPVAENGELVDDLASAEFCALEVDTAGLTQPARTVDVLTKLLGQPLGQTSDGRLVAFDLRSRRADLLASSNAAAVNQRGERVLHRLPSAS